MIAFDTDIIVAGGGLAGLTAAVAFGRLGFDVVCCDPQPPITQEHDPNADIRTTAILQSSVPVLQSAGLWKRLVPHAAALNVMRIVDAGGTPPEPRQIADFVASEISDLPFGWNFPNWLLRREILAELQTLPNVKFHPGVSASQLFTRMNEARVTLGDGRVLAARLVIGADGRNSAMRNAAGIRVHTKRYGQKALSFAVSHDQPHDNISTEVHLTGGPFTLVPLPDRDGQHRSAVVWMDRGPEIARLQSLSDADFNNAATTRSAGVLGQLSCISRRAAWPIITQRAEQMTSERLALMAEAAHVVPPIGAQGLNLSLADLACLLTLATDSPGGLGTRQMLDAYERKRRPDIRTRLQGIDFLNRASLAAFDPIRDVRSYFLGTIRDFAPIRKSLMQAGLGRNS